MATEDWYKNEDDLARERTLRITAEEDSARLDAFLVKSLRGFSRSHIQRFISHGEITLNGEKTKPSTRVRAGDSLVIVIPPPEKSDILPEDIPLDVIFEDDSLIVINKQKNLTVHPTPNRTSGTLVNALLHHCGGSLSGIGGVMRPGIVHRLDKETSGVMVAAKNDASHISLSEQIKDREMEKYYFAIVHGSVDLLYGEVDEPIGRHPVDRKKMAVLERGGRRSFTTYRVMKRFDNFTHLKLQLHTGRTHQIRVHMSHIGHPVAGDRTYGGSKFKGGAGMGVRAREAVQVALDRLEGQALHASEIAFRHPMTGEPLRFTAPPPRDIMDFYDFLKGGGAGGV